jgi:hypothetical protein
VASAAFRITFGAVPEAPVGPVAVAEPPMAVREAAFQPSAADAALE